MLKAVKMEMNAARIMMMKVAALNTIRVEQCNVEHAEEE